MSTNSLSFSYGSVTVDDTGIMKRKPLFIGYDFKVQWDDLKEWYIADSFVTSLDTGRDEHITVLVEIETTMGVHKIVQKAAGEKLDALVAYLRLKCPEKERLDVPEMAAVEI